MTLQKQRVDIPCSGGLGEITSKFIRPAVGGTPPLDIAVNGEHFRLGTLRKRHGFTSFGTGTVSGVIAGARGLCSAGDSLTLIDERRAWRWSPELELWQDRGPVGPGGLRYGETISGARSYDDADTASDGNFTIVAAGATYDEFSVDTAPIPDVLVKTEVDVVRVLVLDTTGVVVLPATDFLLSSTDATRRRSIRCSSTGDKLLMAAQVGLTAPARTLEIREWLPSSPTTLPAVAQTIPGTLAGSRTYDIIRLNNSATAGDYLVAYIDSASNDVELRRYTAAHGLAASATITEDANGVALYEGPAGDIYVVVINTDGVDLYKRRDDLTGLYGPQLVYAFVVDADGAQEGADYPGVASDDVDVAVTFNITDVGSDKARGVAARCRASDGALLDIETFYNCTVLSRPWIFGNRAYVAGATFTNRYPFDCGIVWEVYFNSTNPLLGTGQPTVAAAYHMGTADRPRGAKSAGNVFADGTRVTWLGFRYTKADAEQDTSLAFPLVGQPRPDSLVGVELVSLDYAAQTTCTQTAADELIIGSSLVTFLGSSVTQELGWIVPPVLRNEGGLGSSPQIFELSEGDTPIPVNPGLTPNTTVIYTAIWSWVDSDGVLHRSAPAPPQPYALATPSAGKAYFYIMRAKTTGASNRLVLQDATVEWYHDEISVFRLVPTVGGSSDSPVFAGNEGEQQFPTESILDFGIQGTLQPLYTTGGVLENVAPAGADVAAVIGNRLWIGGQRRVQYSKILTPAVAGGQRLAPEMNEGFSLQLPGGEACTGLEGLDGRTIVFTADSILTVIGSGPNDLGGGGTFELQPTSADEGCKDPRSVVAYPDGIFFQGARGIYELGRNLQALFIGAPVVDQTDEYPIITSAVLVAAKNQVRFTCKTLDDREGRVLVYDYLAKTWTVWHLRKSGPATIVPNSACMHRGVYHVLDKDGVVWFEDESTYLDDTDVWVPLRVRTSWFQGNGQNGWQRIYFIGALGQRHTPCGLTVRAYQDWNDTASQTLVRTDAEVSTYFEITSRLHQQMNIKRQQCTSVAVEIEDTPPTVLDSGQGLELAAFSLEFGLKQRLARLATRQS